jgi:leucyl/phenylalanyl-tRNA--protein transferase
MEISSLKKGPDPDFPYLTELDYFSFPAPEKWKDNIVGIGGNLSPGMLLSAYEQGIFPWYNADDPIIWQSPDPRCVIFPEKLHFSSSMRKSIYNRTFKVTFNENFSGVINSCAEVERPNQYGTWITNDIIEAYTKLHRLGWGFSAEAWQDGELAGGCYGILMGKAFFGESMFSKKKNASKTAFLYFAKALFENGLAFVDCQVPTRHLISLGGETVSRTDFLALLKNHHISRF